MAAINLLPGLVLKVEAENEQTQTLTVTVGARKAQAINYLALGPKAAPGDRVVLNTTAVDLALGSGGCHFVLPQRGALSPGWGHIIKLRYTPLQLRVAAVEEQASPWHHLFHSRGGLEGVPVLSLELHSMVAPLALALKTLQPTARLVYVLTEGGALPAAFSRSLTALKQLGVIEMVVTAGHSFGGDLEAINVYTGLQAAALVAKADYIIVAMGPGIAGTGTVYGFSGLEQGAVLQAAYALGGKPIFVPRLGFADNRQRHWGISHHSLTVLRSAYLGPAWLPLPLLAGAKSRAVAAQLKALPRRYRRCWLSGDYIGAIAVKQPALFSSMGRGYGENPEFFLALGAAARLATALDRSKTSVGRIAIK